jgi:protein phosphatase
LQVRLSQIVKKAMKIPCEKFAKKVEEATELLRTERGSLPNFEILERLVKIKPSGRGLIVGDLHGDLESLVQILQDSNILQNMNTKQNSLLIFLGDYGDRGDFSTEVYYTILTLKIHYHHQIVLMRGNHEGPADLLASPHDLPYGFKERFGENWGEAYAVMLKLFEHLYNCVLVDDRYLIVHGGIPEKAKTLEDLAGAHLSHPKNSFLEEILWSDPDEMTEETVPSPRGAGKLFGKKVTNEALRRYHARILIRGHEPCEEGFKINHDGKVLTLFSRKGPPYFNVSGAYLDVDLTEKFESAEQLLPYVHKF